MKILFDNSEILCRGLWIPSNMLFMIPGPSSTDNGFPVRNTGSPTVKPAITIQSIFGDNNEMRPTYKYLHRLEWWQCLFLNE